VTARPISRRDSIRGLAAIIAAGCSPSISLAASGLRRTVGISNGMIRAHTPTSNDYARRSNLVGCWDALDGFVKTGATTGTLMNIGTGGDHSVTINEYDSNSVSSSYQMKESSNSAFVNPFKESRFTVEFVTKSDVYQYPLNSCGCGCNPVVDSRGAVYRMHPNGFVIYRSSNLPDVNMQSTTDPTSYVTFVAVPGEFRVYVNGSFVRRMLKELTYLSEVNMFSFPGTVKYSHANLSGLHCFRLYNVDLSSDEISANHRIDVARYAI